MTSINHPIAVDPIEYVRVSPSFDYFEPDRNIVNDDGMPGKPSSPLGSVLGLYFHFIHPPLARATLTGQPRV
jgi:hypothetical protein